MSYRFTEPCHKIELPYVAAQWKLPFNQGPFFKTQKVIFMATINKIIPVSITLLEQLHYKKMNKHNS